jgi:4-alpha-glucanotransferase
VFAPAYAIRTDRDWGVGSFADLGGLHAILAERGGEVLSTLPLFAAFLDEPFEPSPYSPVSRLFWNELYVDVEAAPELVRSDEARQVLVDEGFRAELRRLRELDLVDHRRVMAAKRRVLEPLAAAFFDGVRPGAFEDFVAREPRVLDYARFRAEMERRRTWWREWPARERDGRLTGDPEDDPAGRYHLYVQWLAATQLAALDARGHRLNLDMPLGVHGAGYDVWRERRAFVTDGSVGAPPDAFFTGGQDWGFPPLHPDRIREDGYAYPRACVAALARHASAIRIDHVMGLHRLYWVPHGLRPTDGLYVRYRSAEWYAMLSIEAHGVGAIVAGEDLGTVPGYVRKAMRSHAVHTSYVTAFEVSPNREPALRDPPPGCVASLDTHDTPPFAALWSGSDIELHRRLGVIDDDEAAARARDRAVLRETLVEEVRRRGLLGSARTAADVLRACLRFLARSDATIVLASLEDLWLEERPQNVPGTGQEVPNWRGRFRYTLDEIERLPEVRAAFGDLARPAGEVA